MKLSGLKRRPPLRLILESGGGFIPDFESELTPCPSLLRKRGVARSAGVSCPNTCRVTAKVPSCLMYE
ncbi:MAG: hypothetical protein ACM3X9_11015 [Bacillota bacterium]